jgi:hypothetical protein
MIEWNKSKISIKFNAEAVDNRTMSLLITYDDKSWKFLPLPIGDTVWSADINLPSTISLMFGGKTQTDTKIDSHGNIISDMRVIIQNISLDGFDCWDSILANDVIIFNLGTPARLIALRVLTRVITDPVTLMCAMCGNPFEEQDE